jgi:hypothetical protein
VKLLLAAIETAKSAFEMKMQHSDVHSHDPFADINLSLYSQIFKCLHSVVAPSWYHATSSICASCDGALLLRRSNPIHASLADAMVAFRIDLEAQILLEVGGILADRADIFVSHGVSINFATERQMSETVMESLTVCLI